LRPNLLVLTLAVGSVLLASAPAAQAQGYPGWPPGYGGYRGYGGFPGGPGGFGGAPMMAPAASADSSQASTSAASVAVAVDPTAPCRQSIANAAYPVANQMIALTSAANLYPLTPNARPFVGPNQGYPFGGIFTQPGLPGLGLRNTVGGLAAFPQTASPQAALTQIAAGGFTTPTVLDNIVPIVDAAGAVTFQNVGQRIVNLPSPADQLAAAGVFQQQYTNLFAGVDSTQGVFNTRIGAADLNIAMAGFPRAQASNLRDVLEGLLAYRELACPAPASSSDESTLDRLRQSN
jgi:hypothetical protein